MGKIKGWEKMKTQSYHYANYFNVSSSDSLSVMKVGDGSTNIEVFNNKTGKHKIVRNFRTKEQALQYAYAYMRSNPNG